MIQAEFNMNQPEPVETRADQIFNAFREYHQDNPHIWMAFVRFTKELIEAGRKNVGAKAVIERIRWDYSIKAESVELKVNNNFAPYYARLFHIIYPEHDGLFAIRKLTSVDKDASRNNQQNFDSGEPDEESEIKAKLRQLAGK